MVKIKSISVTSAKGGFSIGPDGITGDFESLEIDGVKISPDMPQPIKLDGADSDSAELEK